MVMTKVGIAKLKARLSEHLKRVRKGETITVMDRDTPIAKIVPFEDGPPLIIKPAKGRLHDVQLPPPPRKRVDSLKALLEERGER
jgi:prevent-host-death family protein